MSITPFVKNRASSFTWSSWCVEGKRGLACRSFSNGKGYAPNERAEKGRARRRRNNLGHIRRLSPQREPPPQHTHTRSRSPRGDIIGLYIARTRISFTNYLKRLASANEPRRRSSDREEADLEGRHDGGEDEREEHAAVPLSDELAGGVEDEVLVAEEFAEGGDLLDHRSLSRQQPLNAHVAHERGRALEVPLPRRRTRGEARRRKARATPVARPSRVATPPSVLLVHPRPVPQVAARVPHAAVQGHR